MFHPSSRQFQSPRPTPSAAWTDYTPNGPWADGQTVVRNLDGVGFTYSATLNALTVNPNLSASIKDANSFIIQNLPAPTNGGDAANKTYVDGHAGGGGIAEAPTDGQQYGRQSSAWSVVVPNPSPSSTTPIMDGAAAVGTGTTWARSDHIHPSDTTKAPLASPALTGTPTAPTATANTNTTQIATTAYADAIAALKANIASPVFTGSPLAPTPTAGTNTTQLATTAFVGTALANAAVPAPSSTTPGMDGVGSAGVAVTYSRGDHVHPSDTSRAPLASPALTGTPTAPTPATPDNSTNIATTAFVKIQGYLIGNQTITLAGDITGSGTTAITTTLATVNPNVGLFQGLTINGKGQVTAAVNQGYLTDAPSDGTVYGRQNAGWVAAGGGGGTATVVRPQGRLTLLSGSPVMITSQSGKNTLFYDGTQCPIYNGTAWTSTIIPGGEISALTTDATKSPAAIGVSKINDWFIWNDAGTVRLGHGPDWTNDTTRSAGTALVSVNGILLNSVTITNGPAASRGTFVGTTRSNASSLLDWTLGSAASGGGAAFLNVWNMYDRKNITTQVIDNGAGYTYVTGAPPRQARASAGNQINFVVGQSEDGFISSYMQELSSANAVNAYAIVFIGFNSITAGAALRSVLWCNAANGIVGTFNITYMNVPPIGYNYLAGLEQGDTGNPNVFDNFSHATLSMSYHM
jgi:hypothetical protein